MTDAADVTAEQQEFRPSWAAFHRRLMSRMLLLGPLLVVIVLVASWPSIGLALITLGAAMALGGIAFAAYFGRTRLRVEGSMVRFRGPLRTRGWVRGDIAALVFVPTPGQPPVPPGRERPTSATLYAVSPLNERLFWLSGDFWERDELDRIAQAVGSPVHEAPKGLSAQDVRERFPGTVGWTNVHPWRLALLLAGIAMVLMFTVVVATTVVLIATGQVQLPSQG